MLFRSLYLSDDFNKCCEIVPKLDSSDSAGAYSRNILVPTASSTEATVDRDAMIRDLVDHFEAHINEQASFVYEANSIFTNISERTPLKHSHMI